VTLSPSSCHMIVGNGTPIAEHVKLTREEMLNLLPPDIVRFVGLTIKYRVLDKQDIK